MALTRVPLQTQKLPMCCLASVDAPVWPLGFIRAFLSGRRLCSIPSSHLTRQETLRHWGGGGGGEEGRSRRTEGRKRLRLRWREVAVAQTGNRHFFLSCYHGWVQIKEMHLAFISVSSSLSYISGVPSRFLIVKSFASLACLKCPQWANIFSQKSLEGILVKTTAGGTI